MVWLQLEQEVTTAVCYAFSCYFHLGEWEEQGSAQIVQNQVPSLAEMEHWKYWLSARGYIDF